MTIDGIKKYYNFYSEDLVSLKTHLMSDQSDVVELKTKEISVKSVMKLNEVPDKIKATTSETCYLNKKMKNWKIMQRKAATKINDSQLTSDHLIFSSESETLTNNFCIFRKCSSCYETCRYRLSEINTNNKFLTQEQINNELYSHGHPKNRKNKNTRRNRNLNEAKLELRNHYIKHHSI